MWGQLFLCHEIKRPAQPPVTPDYPSPNIDEDDYRSQLRQHAEQLLADRYLLAEDIATCESIALERYRAFAGPK